jgi:hypothetical protein
MASSLGLAHYETVARSILLDPVRTYILALASLRIELTCQSIQQVMAPLPHVVAGHLQQTGRVLIWLSLQPQVEEIPIPWR